MHKETLADYPTVQELAQRLRLDEKGYRRALALSGLRPDPADWRRHIDRFLLAFGTLLILAGIAAFFAWNWADLGRLAKFGLIEGGILIAALLAWRFGLDSPGGRAGLLATGFLTGVLLALFGQTYQTGADPYGLFLTWSLLILPLALIGRQAGLWILFQLLLNLSLILYYTQVLKPPEGWWELNQLLGPLVWLATTVTDSTLASALFVLNLLALVAWESGAVRGTPWLQGSLFPRLLAFLAFCTTVSPTLVIVVLVGFDEQTRLNTASPLLWVAATAAALYYYRYRRQDLFILTCALLGLILVVSTFLIRQLPMDTDVLLLVALLIIAQVAAAAWWLRVVARRGEDRP